LIKILTFDTTHKENNKFCNIKLF